MQLAWLSWGWPMALMAAWPVSASPAVNIGQCSETWAGEYSSEDSTSYFLLLDEIATGHFASASNDQETYTRFVNLLRKGHIQSPEQLSTFKLALSMRTAAPRIEAHYQYYTNTVEAEIVNDKECPAWVLINDQKYCNPDLETSYGGQVSLPLKHLPFDRTIGQGSDAILYADPTSAEFAAFHIALRKRTNSDQGQLRYRLRYRRNESYHDRVLPVSGYGVELALKRTDYIVIDDREASQESAPQALHKSLTLDDEEEVSDLKPLATSDLATLGLKAASLIMQSDAPLDTLIKLSQDLPKFSTYIASHNISRDFISEHKHNRAQAGVEGLNHLWINGLQLIDRQVEPFSLVKAIRKERALLKKFIDMGLSGKQAVSLLGHDKIASSQVSEETPRFDWTDRAEEGKVIIWFNDLETEDRYAHYSKSFKSLLQRTHPGQLPPISRNVFHMILPVDLSDPEDMDVVIRIYSLMQRGIPVRFGLVPLVSTDEGISQAKIGYYLLSDYGLDAFIEYLKYCKDAPDQSRFKEIFSSTVQNQKLRTEGPAKSFDEVTKEQRYDEQVVLAKSWSRRLKMNTPVRAIFADGIVIPRDGQWMQSVSMKFHEDLQKIQMAVYRSVVKDDEWAPGFFLENASLNRNAYIAPEDPTSARFLDVGKMHREHADLFLHTIPILESGPESSRNDWAVLTVIVDLKSKSGREILLSALKFKRNHPGVRLDIIHNPESDVEAYKVNAAAKRNKAKLITATCVKCIEKALRIDDARDTDFSPISRRFLSFANIIPGEQVLIMNGRIIGPISQDDSFEEEDFKQLFEFEQKRRVLPVYDAMDEMGLADKISSPIDAAKITSITALSVGSDLPEGIFESAPSIRTNMYDDWSSSYTAIELGDPETASVHIAGLLNPLSEQGQKWAPILRVISELDGIYMKLFVNPKENIDELPIKRFYRYVLNSKPSFNEHGSLKEVNATFKSLPSETLLTTSMDVPPAWLVAPKASLHDLDNIKLSPIRSGGVEAVYQLENVLIEGHSREGRGSVPRGAQLVLATDRTPLLTDTIIMSNLGFFQFKANPGFYNIRLKEGRSAKIFTIESLGTQGSKPVAGDEGTEVVLMDFQGTTLYPRLNRQPGMENLDVLGDKEENAPSDSLAVKGLKFASNLFGGAKEKGIVSSEHADINIFSVASGHLYERMLNIMMVSVMRNTKHTVKFWFIEQFLSPSFKEFIPYMAQEYGFKYEMVTYKWPHWLRQQKEKQREIWGYKILFLDVLFPLSLDKIIFVDADQIVRTDMIDLVNHDLKGAPYGFTPMCDSRTEMDGFRFWKQGYWASYLRGLPYHISALYVVDLGRFRELAAGDRLRQQYQTLSADKNSLSNLDQDLPNNMQFQIPIHSLPQEWLWCETWCSDESLSAARTIDLCNNPETKEPKLDRARRQVPEWTVYDEEIAALDKKRKGAIKKENVNTKSRRFEEAIHTRDEL